MSIKFKKIKIPKDSTGKMRFLLRKSKWISILSVTVLLLSVIILVLSGLVKIVFIIYDMCVSAQNNILNLDIHVLSAQLLTIVDIYLLAVVIYIFAIAIFKLFIGQFVIYSWLKIEDLDDLKTYLAKIIIIFLNTFLVQKIVLWEEPEHVLRFGIVISMVSTILIAFLYIVKNKKSKNTDTRMVKEN